jgi:hypothetical protein
MSTDRIKKYDDQDALKLACPACIEAATVVKGGKEVVPRYALHKYTFEQLGNHLNSNKHSREQLIEVAMRAAAFLYCHAFEKIESFR